MSSTQNEGALVLEKEVLKNEQGQTRREGAAKLRNLERTYILNVPLLDIVIVKGTQSNKPEQIMTNITQNEA